MRGMLYYRRAACLYVTTKGGKAMGDDFERRRQELWRRLDEMVKEPEAYTGETIIQPGRQPDPSRQPQPQPGRQPDSSRQPQARPGERVRPKPAKNLPQRAPRSYRRPRIWPRIRLVLVVVLLLLAVSLVAVYWQARSLSAVIGANDVRSGLRLTPPLLGGVNLLLVGVDEREGAPEEGVRSDTLIVAHLNGPGGWANLLSIPRDTLVELPLPEGMQAQKINTAYGTGYARAEELYGSGTTPQQGGMALSAETVERFLGIPIHYTAQINFDGFARLIDALGGVTIDVPKYIFDPEYPTPDFGYMTVEFQPGVQRMNGATALIYARTRHADSDFDRGKRQQQVLRAIIDEVRSKSRFEQLLLLPALRESLRGTVLTTLPVERLDVQIGLAQLSRLDPAVLGQFRISPETVTLLQEDAFSNLYWDPEGVRAQVGLLTSAPSVEREAASVQVFNGTDTAGLATRISNRLTEAGLRVVPPGDAPPGEYLRTQIYVRGDKPLTAARLERELGALLVPGPIPEGLFSEADIVVVLGQDQAE